MSSPLPHFSKLSITQTMQYSGVSAHSQAMGKGKGKAPVTKAVQFAVADEDEEEEEEEEEDDDEEHDDDDDDASDTSDTSWSGRVLALDHCREIDQCYAFQIAYAEPEYYSVRINPTDAVYRQPPTCTCQSNGTCHHVQWLLERIGRTSANVVGAGNVGPYERIRTVGLGNVCDQLQWELREGSDSEETIWDLKKSNPATDPGRRTRQMTDSRKKLVRDIMATLSPSQVVTEDYRPDLFVGGGLNSATIYQPKDVDATLARLLMVNDEMLNGMKSVVYSEIRASVYFSNAMTKADTACKLLEQYSQNGPIDGEHYTVIWCATELSNIVGAIRQNLLDRSPLPPASREAAAKALVDILDMVVHRNHEAYQGASWPRHKPHGEPQVDRNLYLRLIGLPSKAKPAMPANFVLDTLQDLPEARAYIEKLEDIWYELGTIGWTPTPTQYRSKLAGILQQLKGFPFPNIQPSTPSSSSSGKRGGSIVDRKAKRMK